MEIYTQTGPGCAKMLAFRCIFWPMLRVDAESRCLCAESY